MRSTYRVLAWAVPVLVLVQAAAIAFGFFGLVKWVDDGNSLTSGAMESENTDFSGVAGLMVHGVTGMMVIPVVALVLLVLSFFAHVPRGTLLAGLIVLDVMLQIALAFVSFSAPVVGTLHGLNAFVLAGLGVAAARAAAPARPATVGTAEPTAA